MRYRMCWLYNPNVCDGHECIKDCDHCSYSDKVIELEENETEAEQEQTKKLKKWIRMMYGKDE